MTNMELELKLAKDVGLEKMLLLKYITLKYLNTNEPVYLPITKVENCISVCSLLKIGKSKAIPLIKDIAYKTKKGEDVLHDKPLSYYVTMSRETFFVPQETILELWKNTQVDNIASPFYKQTDPLIEFELLMSFGAKTFYLIKLLTELFITNNFVPLKVPLWTISELLGISTKTIRRILKKVGQKIKSRDSFENAEKLIVYKATRDGHYWIYVQVNMLYDMLHSSKNVHHNSFLKNIIPILSTTDTKNTLSEKLYGTNMELNNSNFVHSGIHKGQNRRHIYNNIYSNKDYLNKNKDNTFIYDKNTEENNLKENLEKFRKENSRGYDNNSDNSYLEENSSFIKLVKRKNNKNTGGLKMKIQGISKKIYSAHDVDTNHVKSSDEILKQLKDKKFNIDFSLFDKKELTPKRFNDVLNSIYSSVGCPEQVFYSIDLISQRAIKKMIKNLKQEGMSNSDIVRKIYMVITRWDELKKHPKLNYGSRIRIKGTVPTFWEIYSHHKDFFVILDELDNKKDDYEDLGIKAMTLDEYKKAKKNKA